MAMSGEFRVRRTFTAGGKIVQMGTIVTDPAWKNTESLLETGYIVSTATPLASSRARRPLAPEMGLLVSELPATAQVASELPASVAAGTKKNEVANKGRQQSARKN